MDYDEKSREAIHTKLPILPKDVSFEATNSYQAIYPSSIHSMERICIDAIGPISGEGQDSEYKYILVIIDAFSRFVRLYPVTDTSALSALGPLNFTIEIYFF